jgi:hypothetical protein
MILIYSLVAKKYLNHFLGLKSLFVIANTVKHFLVFLFIFKKAFITFYCILRGVQNSLRKLNQTLAEAQPNHLFPPTQKFSSPPLIFPKIESSLKKLSKNRFVKITQLLTFKKSIAARREELLPHHSPARKSFAAAYNCERAART